MKYIKIIIILILLLVITFSIFFLLNNKQKKQENKMIDLSEKTILEIEEYAVLNNLELIIEREYSDTIPKDKLISQSIEIGNHFK